MAAVAGKVMMRPMGEYDPAVIYDIIDVVSHNDKAWICKRVNTVGVEPTEENTDHWQLLIDAAVADAATLKGHAPEYFATAEEAKTLEERIINTTNTITTLESTIKEKIETQVGSVTLESLGAAAANHTHTPASIGAAASSHTHTPASIGAAAASHNQAASTITAGTLAGQVLANATAQATVTTAQVRNIYAGTTDMTAGTTALATGAIYLVYE